VNQYIQLDLQYGTTVSGEWIADLQPANLPITAFIGGDDYNTLVTTAMTNDSELTYAAVKRCLYEWLYDNGFIASGIVV